MTGSHARNDLLNAVNGVLMVTCFGVMVYDLLDAAASDRPCTWLTIRIGLLLLALALWNVLLMTGKKR